MPLASLGFSSQIATVLEIELAISTLERKKDGRRFQFLSPMNIVRQFTFSLYNALLKKGL
jgi:hypothetical protein